MIAFSVALMVSMLQAPAATSSIGGVVTRGNAALEQSLQNARLELTGGPGTPLVVRTDTGGRFLFSNLAPGRYKLSVTRDGYLRQEHPKPIVLGRGQQVTDIVFRLDPAPVVTGWVQDRYGAPIANVLVEALRQSYDARGNRTFIRAASSLTDDRGEYRIFWLDPGEYFFYASTPPANDLQAPPPSVAPTYFPGVTDPADAKPVRLGIGREVRGADFELGRAAMTPIRGYLSNVVTGQGVSASIVLARPSDDPGLSRYTARSAAAGPSAGQFALSEPVPPGAYIVTGKGEDGIAGYARIAIRAVTQPPPPYDLRLSLSPPRTMTGRTFVESGATVNLKGAKVSLTSVDGAFPSPPVGVAQPDGGFMLAQVPMGSYVLDVSELPDGFYLKAARLGSVDILENPLVIQSGSASNLDLLLGSDGGRLRVAVFDSKEQVHEGARVVLVPDTARRHRPEQYRVALSGEDGRIEIRGIPPGSYRMFAWESIEPNAHLNSEVIRSFDPLGFPVQIKPGDNDPVSLRLIPKE